MTVLSTNEAEQIAHDADDLAVIDTINSVLDRVEEDLLLEGTSYGTVSNASAAEASASGSLRKPEDNKAEENEAKTAAIATLEESDRDIFKVKTIHFDSLKFSIVTQNLNGPCPLIALVNVLVLKGIARLPSSGHVTRDALTHLVADTLLQMRPDNMNTHVESNYNRNLDDVINLLPDLGKGLDVNIRFRHVTDFEFTPALSLFDLLRVNLYHGWLPDPQFVEIQNAIGELTYNHFLLAQEMQACEDELARQEAERERIKESVRQEVPPPAQQYSPTSSSRATYERTTYRNGRPIAATSSSKEKKCTIS
ncbi:hypothetical protein ANCCAN_15680 [Ancylostoma caninum]|uniref:Ubiquitin carboxyl-terminal hydrolase n=1 Tax=Ancylostoma caninum TaxID=29170 RepID=A0A368G1Q7_ANCCA|nr:hypothetical protein ANCCAN_15680 [Ancylostoma caninum]